MKKHLATLLAFGMMACSANQAYANFIEQNGLVVMEAENGELANDWATRTTVPAGDPNKIAGFTGNGYIEWTGQQFFGNTIQPSQAQGVIKYTFTITNPGVYNLRWRTKQKDAGQTFDAGNDTFVRWATGTTPSGSRNWNNFTKVFIQNKTSWDLNFRAEPEHAVFVTNDFKRQLAAGTHTIELAARSPGHVIDRLIVFRSDVPFNANQFVNAAESPRTGVPIGQTIALKSVGNGMYVAADRNLDVTNWPLAANRTVVGAWEKFQVVDAGGGMIALKANGNGKFVASDKFLDAVNWPLAANRTAVGAWEKFEWINNSDGTISLKANGNGKFIAADKFLDAINWPLVANRTAIGAWEKFTVEIQ